MSVEAEGRAPGTSYFPRAAGIAIGGAPVFLLVASLCVALARGSTASTSGLVAVGVGLFIASANAWASFGRPLLHHLAKRPPASYKHVSPGPLLGTVAVVASGILGFGSAPCAGLGLLAVALDTGGSVWGLILLWRDPTFWAR